MSLACHPSRAPQRERALALALLASLLVNVLACGCCLAVYRHVHTGQFGATPAPGEAHPLAGRRLLAQVRPAAAARGMLTCDVGC